MEANWKPLIKALGEERCMGFLFMGTLNGLFAYKHGVTRSYLYLDDDGNSYSYSGDGCFVRAELAGQIQKLEADLEALGCTLETPYDDEFIAMKKRVFARHGIPVEVVQLEPREITAKPNDSKVH